MKLDIKTLLAEHPNLHINFHDKDTWMLFHDKSACDAFGESGCRNGLLAEGDDEYVWHYLFTPVRESHGYLPILVAALARAIGITADSA